MTRRRLILATCFVIVAVATAWWVFSDRLTVDEQRLVGTWHLRINPSPARPAGSTSVWELGHDRSCRFRELDPTTGAILRAADGTALEVNGRWRIAEGRLTFDWAGPLVRLRRMIPEALPGSLPGVTEQIHIESAGENEVILDALDGKQYRLVRDAPRQ
jgi:hypothetical protein